MADAAGVRRLFSLLAAAAVAVLAWASSVSGQSAVDLPNVSQLGTSAGVPAVSLGAKAAVPGGSRRSMGLAQAKTGWALIQEGNYTAANEAFAQAAELAPHQAPILVGLGLSYQLLGHDERAIATLERAIHLDMSVGKAHVLLGDLYARRGELERAIHRYRFAMKQHPGDVMLAHRLELAEAEYRLELEFDRVYSAHFQVKFRASATEPRLAHRIADRLEGAYHQVGEAFSFYPTGVLTVIVYPDQEFWETTDSPQWARGLFDGAIHLPAEAARRDSSVAQRLLRHEYIHAVVDRLSAGRVPVWLSEGLAVYFEGYQDHHAGGTLHRSDRDNAVSARAFHREFIALPSRDAQAAYAQSYGATHALIERYGLGRVRTLLDALSKTSDFSHAFETAFHAQFKDFEAEWLNRPAGQRF